MFIRLGFIGFTLLSLTSCAHLRATAPTEPNTPITYFTQVQVDGNLDVSLHTGAPRSQVILHGDARDKPEVKMRVAHGVLYVHVERGFPHFARMNVDIYTHYLTSFTYVGSGTIVGRNLQSKGLDISITNRGKTTLEGQLTLRHLSIKGSGLTQINGINGHALRVKLAGKPRVQLGGNVDINAIEAKDKSWLSLYWINSRVLKIRERGQAVIQLAGIAEILDIELWDSAHFNGRYLRSTRVFAKTHDNAVADLSVIKRQHTLAMDSSNIYYHTAPDMKANFMADNGAVLDFYEWERPFMETGL
jgi:hypothetical protein